jgi:sulfate adenylyltransferase
MRTVTTTETNVPGPSAPRRGCTVFLTGLSGAGKSTIAEALVAELLVSAGVEATLLDGDRVRAQLAPHLGFSKEDRDRNVRRVGEIAAEITGRGQIAICALIAPYEETRRDVQRLIEQAGEFVLVYVATPLGVCEARDPKGLYAKARAGLISGFTGVSDPYEPPATPSVVIDTTQVTPQQASAAIVRHLVGIGVCAARDAVAAPQP